MFSGTSTLPCEVQQAIAEQHERARVEDIRIARYIEQNPEESITEAKRFVERFLSSPAHSRYHWILKRWQVILRRDSATDIAKIFKLGSESTEELRSSTPFCGAHLEAFA